jgi:hypothetical protein
MMGQNDAGFETGLEVQLSDQLIDAVPPVQVVFEFSF